MSEEGYCNHQWIFGQILQWCKQCGKIELQEKWIEQVSALAKLEESVVELPKDDPALPQMDKHGILYKRCPDCDKKWIE